MIEQLQFRRIKIGFTDLSSHGLWVGVGGVGKNGVDREIAEEKLHQRRGPCRHVEMHCKLWQLAREIIATFGEIEPERRIGCVSGQAGALV